MVILYVPPKKDTIIALANHGGYLYQTGRFQMGDIGGWDWDYLPYSGYYMKQARALLQYEIPDLPKGSIIIKATLKIQLNLLSTYPSSWNRDHVQVNKQPIFAIHKIEEHWDEGTGDGFTDGHQYSGATWTHRTNQWHTWGRNGGTFTETPIGQYQADFREKSGEVVSFDVTDTVKDWVRNPAENYGILLRLLNDRTVNEGRFNFWTRETAQPSFFNTSSHYNETIPTIHLEYSTPPEMPIGLEPNYFSTISPNLHDSMRFKWTYTDEIPDHEEIQQHTDIVLLINNANNSYSWRKSHYKEQVGRLIDRLEAQKITYRMAIVTYSDINYSSKGIQKGWIYSDRHTITSQFDRVIVPDYLWDGDWRDSALEAIKDPNHGALTYYFGNRQSKVHFVVIGDNPYHSKNIDNLSVYNIDDVAQELRDKGIICTVVGTYFSEISRLSIPTGGSALDINSNFGDSIPLHTHKQTLLQEDLREDSFQSRAVIRIYEKTAGGGRTLRRTIEHNSSAEDVMVPTNIFTDGLTYEWDIITYDNHGLASPPSHAAPFVYRTLTAPKSLPVWAPLPKEKEPIKKSHLEEIKQSFLIEGVKYNNVNASGIHQLFTSDLVPSKDDFDFVQKILDDMSKGEGIATKQIVNSPNGFGVQQLIAIRERIMQIVKHGPDTPKKGTATLKKSDVVGSSTLRARSALSTEPEVVLEWDSAQLITDYIQVPTYRVQDEDIAYYKMNFSCRYEYVVKGNTKKQSFTISRTYYYTPEQIGEATLEILLDSDQYLDYKLSFQAVDKSQQSSGVSQYQINSDTPGNNSRVTLDHNELEFQVRDSYSTGPDKEGKWYPLRMVPIDKYSFSHLHYGEGRLWYRLKPANSSEWVYSSTIIQKNTRYEKDL